MNKIPTISWIKMVTVVSIHLCLVGWVIYCYREPVINCSAACWGYVTVAYESCANYVAGVWEKIPSLEQLTEGFINILKLKPFR